MKKILLLSDTHGFFDDWMAQHISESDEVWHAGDVGNPLVVDQIQALKPLRCVYGNIDGAAIRGAWPLDNSFDCQGLKVWMTHIGGYPGRYESRVNQLWAHHNPGLFISGHSHILKVIWDKKKNCLHMNPGACGLSGFHQKRTMLRFVVEHGAVRDLVVIEKEKARPAHS